MGDYYLKQSVESKNYSASNSLDDCDLAEAQKLVDIFVGDVELYESTGETVGSSVPYPAVLNPHQYSIGKKIKRGKYLSSTNFFKDVKQGKTINDFEDIASSFDCHKNSDIQATYVNLSRDVVEV